MASLWKQPLTLTEANELIRGTICDPLAIVITEITEQSVSGTMPVDARTHQPFGVLHGGASCVLAESLGSFAANMAVGKGRACVGLEINANHVRPVNSGLVTGTATAIHIGKTTQIWEIKIHTEEKKLVCISRLTVAVIDK